MSLILKILSVAVIFICMSAIMKTNRPEFLIFIRIGAIIIISILIIDSLSQYVSQLFISLNLLNIDEAHLSLLIKAVGITLLTDFVTDVLSENGEKSVSGIVNLAGRIIILTMALPLINGLIEICLNMIEN